MPDFGCGIATWVGQLKHSWLENQVLDKTPDFIVRLRGRGGWPVLENEFPANVLDAQRLADELETGFSPAQLVERLTPFGQLSLEDKEQIKQAVHRAYLQTSNIQALKAPLEEMALAMREAVKKMLTEWRKPDYSEQALRKAWEGVLHKARGLRDCLDRLPKGIVLP